MQKNILIINTGLYEAEWLEYLDNLSTKGFSLHFLGNDPKLLSYFRIKNWENIDYKVFLNPDSKSISTLFFLLRPVLFFYALFFLSYYKFSKKIESVVCFMTYDKIHFTLAAKLLGIKTVWIMSPGYGQNIPKISRFYMRLLSKKATVICLTEKCQKVFSAKPYNFKNARHLRIGIGEKHYQEQKNIFQTLAKNNSQVAEKKYFTVGTIQDLCGDVTHIEILFHAIKKCLEVIPQIQLIIAGDGPERKRLTWMARKMDIGNLVWFVGNHKNPHKWLANFDIYISTCPSPKLKDLNTILLASSNSMAVIAPSDCGFEEFITDKESGLLANINDSEDVAQAIIELQQNAYKREKIGKNASEFVNNTFNMDKTIEELYEIIKK